LADPLAPALAALRRRKDLLGWTARHRFVRSEQLFCGRKTVDARRSTESSEIAIEVLCPSEGSGDAAMCGAATARLGAGDDPAPAIDFAVAAARRTRNPIYDLPAAGAMPDVPLVDAQVKEDPRGVVEALQARLAAASASDEPARLTLAEWFAENHESRIVNSRGIDAGQQATELSLEWIALAGESEERVETILDLSRRRLADIDVEAEWAALARHTADRHLAAEAPAYDGPVVLRGRVIAEFINSGVFETMASAQSRYARISNWEVGKTVLKGERRGDPLTLWATRMLPFGTHAGRFDSEGIPASRVCLIRDGTLQAYAASQRYATYLGVPATGAYGDTELEPGESPAADLVAEPHVEIAAWSWFSPNPTTGDFAAEIRLGYQVDGRRKPFTGGLLVGNVLEALADVRWSREAEFSGDFQGPKAGRFARLRVVPSRA
jgi:predicted Zn-dependent protease